MKTLNIFDDDGPIDMALIETFESQVQIEFPQEYKLLLSKHDALYSEECIFDYSYEGRALQSDVTFCGYSNPDNAESIVNVQQGSFGHTGVVVFGIAANGDYICFDGRKNARIPVVAIMLHDTFEPNDKMVVVKVADDFVRFINSLQLDEDEGD